MVPAPLVSDRARLALVGCIVAAGAAASVVVSPPAAPVPGPVESHHLWHGGGYLALGLAVAYAVGPTALSRRARLLAVLAVPIAAGTTLECLQLFAAGRTFAVADLAANALGATAAAACWRGLETRLTFVPVDRFAGA